MEEALGDANVDAVAVATDAPTHHALALAALKAGKHVLVEKPLAMSSADAAELVALARRLGRKLMVGHVLEYHPAVRYLEKMVREGELGRVYYAYTQRINLGVVRQRENAWWSLAPHDVAMLCRLFGGAPDAVSASGQSFLQPGVEDVVFATLRFADGRMGHVHVSWLDPHKVRRLTLVGTRRMMTFDDMSAGEKVRVYDKGVNRPESLHEFPDTVTLRSGDIVIPRITGDEPLAVQCRAFVDAVLDDAPIETDGENGLRVVRVLEAGQESLRSGGGFSAVREA
jgi:predicted dehydrogenase